MLNLSQLSVKKIVPTPNMYFSPGFYMDFWDRRVVTQFKKDVIIRHNKFKIYRELWIGAVMAAAFSQDNNEHFFVGLPDTEPPDVAIARIVPVELGGKEGQNLELLPVEIVRCDLDANEVLFEQILHKNTVANEDYIVGVYTLGAGKVDNLEEINGKLHGMKVFPSQYFLIAQIDEHNGVPLPESSYIVTQIYPGRTEIIVNRNNSSSFFRGPEVIRKSRRAFSREIDPGGNVILMPPDISA